MKRKIRYICAECGEDSMIFDTTSSWNADTQNWELENEYDHKPVCVSEACMGEERDHKVVDAETGEELGTAPGSYEYIPKAEAEAAWAEARAKREAERAKNQRDMVQQAIVEKTAHILRSAYEVQDED